MLLLVRPLSYLPFASPSKAGLSVDRIVEAHGSFASSHCLECRAEVPHEDVRRAVFQDEVPRCPECEGLVKVSKGGGANM